MKAFDEGCVAIVTGAGNGIGRAISLGFAEAGVRVALVDRDEQAAKAVASQIDRRAQKAVSIETDVSHEPSVEAMVQRVLKTFGRIDILVNDAAILRGTAPTWEVSAADWDEIMAVNLRGTFLCSKAVLPAFIARRAGTIVNVSSTAGKEGNPFQSAYAASKAGQIAFTKSLAREVVEYNIRVNAVSPGVTATDFFYKRVPVDQQPALLARIPMGRPGRPDEIAAVVLFLASNQASFVTGQCYDCSGGRAVY